MTVSISVSDIPLGEAATATDDPSNTAAYGDALGVTRYVDALSKFINECGTPMTIAIQGDWGTGKTSMMRLVQKNLGEGVYSVWFNTWQYSQFSMESSLPLSFLSAVAAEVTSSDAQEPLLNRVKNITNSLTPLLGRAAFRGVLNRLLAISGG